MDKHETDALHPRVGTSTFSMDSFPPRLEPWQEHTSTGAITAAWRAAITAAPSATASSCTQVADVAEFEQSNMHNRT